MEVKLEVVRSVAIQRRKPWSSFAWLQVCGGCGISNGLFLLDTTRVSQLSLSTGKTRRNFPSLSRVQSVLALTHVSRSGSVLAGLTVHGHMFTWLQPYHQLATYTTPLSTPSPHADSLKGCHLFVSDSGEQALLVTSKLDLHLWELREGLYSEWWQLPAPDDLRFPREDTRQVAIDANFYVHQVLGECCECNIVFTTQETGETTIAHCLLSWKQMPPAGSHTSEQISHNANTSQNVQGWSEGEANTSRAQDGSTGSNLLLEKNNRGHAAASTSRHHTSTNGLPSRLSEAEPASSKDSESRIPVHITWKTCTVLKSESLPAPRGRGCYVARISPTGRVSAVALNHYRAADTHVVFTDLLNEVSVSSHLYTNRNDVMTGRTFWITSLAWSGDGLLLAAMTRRGCLVLLPRFGPPLKLVSTGCSLDMGPARFLPLHPLITLQNTKGLNITDHETSESSERDTLRQRFSVASHPYLPVVLCSDGYCVTVFKLHPAHCTLPRIVCSLANTCRSILGLREIRSLSKTQTRDNSDECVEESNSLVLGESKQILSCELETLGGCEDGFTASLTLPSSGYFPAVEAGRVCFAGMDDSHCLSHTQDLGQVSGKERGHLARAHLLAAWGMLLSASSFQPGNGIYRSHLSANKAKSLSTGMHIANNVTITALATFPCSLLTPDGSRNNQEDCIASALSLASLDQFDQTCHKIVCKLANTYLMSLLSRLLQEHKRFTSSSNYTLLSMDSYAKFITSSLRHFWKAFQRIVMLVTGLYSTYDSQRIFSLPLLVLKRISNIFSKDLLACNKLAEKMLTSERVSPGMQDREVTFLHRSVARHIGEAAAILDGISNTLVTHFSHDLSTMAVPTGPNTDRNAASDAHNVDLAHRGADHALPHLLQTCQLKQALELVYSLIAQRGDCVSACRISVPGTNLVPPAILAGIYVTHPHLNIMLLTLARCIDAFFSSKKTGAVRFVIPDLPNTSPLKGQISWRHLELESKSITLSVHDQCLSNNWTPTHAVELYLLSGQWYEAAKLSVKMGDWKKGLILCVVCIMCRMEPQSKNSSVTSESVRVERFAQWLAQGKILRALGLSTQKEVPEQVLPDLPYISSILSVCSHGKLNSIGPEVSCLALCRMWRAVGGLPVRVPECIHLPAPPLYYLQPAMSEDHLQGFEEVRMRQTLSQLVQAYLSMLQACSCVELCHHWYASALVELHRSTGDHASLRHMPSGDGSITLVEIPPSLKELATGQLSVHELSSCEQYQLAMFREQCGLLWALHARDNASHCLRQVFHSSLSNKVCRVDTEQTTSECALWCARLLPLCNCFKHEDPSEIQDMLLSVVSELPCNKLMATLLAQNFPNNQHFVSRRRYLQLKMDQLLARMRSTVTVEGGQNMPELLSVDYQIMSKAVLEDQGSDVCECFSPQCFQSDNNGHKPTMSDKALEVGSHPFEYDQAYFDFLDMLFSITFTKRSVPLSLPCAHLLPPQYPPPPYATLAQSTMPHTQTRYSQHSHPVVASLYEWSQSADLSVLSVRVTGTTHDPGHNVEEVPIMKVKRGRSRSRGDTPPMRIEISLSFLTYILLLEEEKWQRTNTSNTASSSTLEEVTDTQCAGEESMTTVTPVLEGTTSTMTNVTPDIDSTTLSDSTLYAEDLTTIPSKKSAQVVIDGHLLEEFNSSSIQFGQHRYPLLQIPDDMCMTYAEEHHSLCRQSQLATSEPALSVSLSTTSAAGGDTASTMGGSHQASSGQLGSGLECDLTDSQSTGELPSQLTFSVGEIGSDANPNSTAENLAPLQPTLTTTGGSDYDSNAEKTHPLLHVPSTDHTPSLTSSGGGVLIADTSHEQQGMQHIPMKGGENGEGKGEVVEEGGELYAAEEGGSGGGGSEGVSGNIGSKDVIVTVGGGEGEAEGESGDNASRGVDVQEGGKWGEEGVGEKDVESRGEGVDVDVQEGGGEGEGMGGNRGMDMQEGGEEGDMDVQEGGGEGVDADVQERGGEGVDVDVQEGGGEGEGMGGNKGMDVLGKGGKCENKDVGVREGGGEDEDEKKDVNREGGLEGGGEGHGVSENGEGGEGDGGIGADNGSGSGTNAERKEEWRSGDESLRRHGDSEADEEDKENHHVGVKQCRESRATAGVRDRPGSQEFEDVRTQDTDIGGIVRSEMMKFLQVQHQQLMKMLETREAKVQEVHVHVSAVPPLDTASAGQHTATGKSVCTSSRIVLPVEQHQESCHVDHSVPDVEGQRSVSSDLSTRHLHHEDTRVPIPAPPLLTTPLLRGPALHKTQPLVHHSHTLYATGGSCAEYHGFPALPLLHVDQHEDHVTYRNDCSTSGGDNVHVMQSSSARRSDMLDSVPLLTLDYTEEEQCVDKFPPIAQVPQLHSATTPEHIALPLLHCQPPDLAAVRLVDVSVGRSNRSSMPAQLIPHLPTITAASRIRPTDPVQVACTSMPPLVLAEEYPPIFPPPPPAAVHAHIGLPTKPIQLLPADILLGNKSLPLLCMEDPVGGISQANIELLQLPEHPAAVLHHVPPVQSAAVDRNTSSSGESSSQGKSKRSHHRRKRQRTGHEQTTPSLPPSSDHNTTMCTSSTNISPQPTHDTVSKHPSPLETEPSQEPVARVHVSASASGKTQEISPTCERLGINMQAAYLPNNHNEDVPELEANTKPQPTPRALFPSNESEDTSLGQPSGQTADNSMQTVTSPVPSTHVQTVTSPVPSTHVQTVTSSVPSMHVQTVTSPVSSTHVQTVSSPVPSTHVQTVTFPVPSTHVQTVTSPVPSTHVQTVTSPVPSTNIPAPGTIVGRQFLCITDIDIDEGSSPSDERSVASECHSSEGENTVEGVSREEERGSGSLCERVQRSGQGEERESVGLADREVHTQRIGHSPESSHHQNERPHASGECSEGTEKEDARTVARREVLSQLQQLESQLSAIENTARTVQGELLASSQLLGAIDELQAVSKTAPGVNVSQYHTPAELTDATNRHATTTNPNKVASTTPHRQAVVKERDTYTHPIAPHSSGATIVGPTTAGLALPSRSPPALRPAHCVAMVTPHVAMVTSHAGVGRAVQCVKSEVSNRTQHHGHAYFSDHSSLLSGRCSKETLKKWVAAKKRERVSTTSAETWTHRTGFLSQQMVSNSPAEPRDRRSQSQEHMARRMEDALTLMEDILSSEPQSTHRSTPQDASTCQSSHTHTRTLGHHSTATSQLAQRGKTVHTNNPAHQLAGLSTAATDQPVMRYCSSVEGLTVQEQIKMAQIMASTELSSVSSGSVATHINWDLVDHLIDN